MVWVGLGPFAGIIALTVHSVAIDSIDPGPIEAVQATGIAGTDSGRIRHDPDRTPHNYVPQGANTLLHIFHDHFHAFADAYDSPYAQDYGKFRLERISHMAERIESCGDDMKGTINGMLIR